MWFPLLCTGSLSISRWPPQLFLQIKTNRKFATRLRSPPAPCQVSAHCWRVSFWANWVCLAINTELALKWWQADNEPGEEWVCARPSIGDICHGAFQTDSLGVARENLTNSPIWQGVQILNGAFLIWKSPRQRMPTVFATAWRTQNAALWAQQTLPQMPVIWPTGPWQGVSSSLLLLGQSSDCDLSVRCRGTDSRGAQRHLHLMNGKLDGTVPCHSSSETETGTGFLGSCPLSFELLAGCG